MNADGRYYSHDEIFVSTLFSLAGIAVAERESQVEVRGIGLSSGVQSEFNRSKNIPIFKKCGVFFL